MDIFITAFVLVFGLSVGSFLNVLVDRLPRNESVLKGRSHCEFCKKKLDPLDLIPLFSFLFLRGCCRFCRKPLSWYYPFVELITGMLFLLTFFYVSSNFHSNFNFQFSGFIELPYYLFITSLLIVIFFTDLKYGIIPDKIVYSGIVISFIYSILNTQYLILNHLLSGIGAFLFFLVLFVVTRGRGMGLGDVKFAFLQGLLLGFPKIIVGFYTAFLTGAVVAIILVIWGKKRFRGGTIPFGPFLVIGTIIGLFWGGVIWQQILPGLPW